MYTYAQLAFMADAMILLCMMYISKLLLGVLVCVLRSYSYSWLLAPMYTPIARTRSTSTTLGSTSTNQQQYIITYALHHIAFISRKYISITIYM
jgi:hypothetical protein